MRGKVTGPGACLILAGVLALIALAVRWVPVVVTRG